MTERDRKRQRKRNIKKYIRDQEKSMVQAKKWIQKQFKIYKKIERK